MPELGDTLYTAYSFWAKRDLETEYVYIPRIEGLATGLYYQYKNPNDSRTVLTEDEVFQLAKDLELTIIGYSKLPFRGIVEGNVLLYNNLMTDPQVRFTVAHEIGHIILGHTSTQLTPSTLRDPIALREYFKNQIEASYFAASLLMPEPLARTAIFRSGYDFVPLVDMFAVTHETAARRLVSLSDIPMHFISVNSRGLVLRSISNTKICVPLRNSYVCMNSSAFYALLKLAIIQEMEKDPNAWSNMDKFMENLKAIDRSQLKGTRTYQFSYSDNGPLHERYFCYSFAYRGHDVDNGDLKTTLKILSVGCLANDSGYLQPMTYDTEAQRVGLYCDARCNELTRNKCVNIINSSMFVKLPQLARIRPWLIKT